MQNPGVGVEVVGVVGLGFDGAARHLFGLVQIASVDGQAVGVAVHQVDVVGIHLQRALVVGIAGRVVQAVVAFGQDNIGLRLEIPFVEAHLLAAFCQLDGAFVAAVVVLHDGLHIVGQGVQREQGRGAPCVATQGGGVGIGRQLADQQGFPHLVSAAVARQVQSKLVRSLVVSALAHQHVAVQPGKGGAVVAVAHSHLEQVVGVFRVNAIELFVGIEVGQNVQFGRCREAFLAHSDAQFVVGLAGLGHSLVVFGQRDVYVLVVGILGQDAVVAFLGLVVILGRHIHLGQDAVVSAVVGQRLGQGFHLLHRLVVAAHSGPQLGFLGRHRLGYADHLLHAVQRGDGVLVVLGHQVGVAQLVVVVDHVGLEGDDPLPRGNVFFRLVGQAVEGGQVERIPDVVAVQLDGAERQPDGAVGQPLRCRHTAQLVQRRRILRVARQDFAVSARSLFVLARLGQHLGVDHHCLGLQLLVVAFHDGGALVFGPDRALRGLPWASASRSHGRQHQQCQRHHAHCAAFAAHSMLHSFDSFCHCVLYN